MLDPAINWFVISMSLRNCTAGGDVPMSGGDGILSVHHLSNWSPDTTIPSVGVLNSKVSAAAEDKNVRNTGSPP
jgi:hypothetical protein